MAVALLSGNGNLSVGIAAEQVLEIEAALKAVNGGAAKAITAAINDTLRYARTMLVRAMREHLNLRAGDVRDRITIAHFASDGEYEGVLRLDYKAVPLEDFRARFRKKSGVVVTTVKEEGLQSFRHMFRATMQSGHTGIFERDPAAPFRPMRKGYWADRRIKRGPRKGMPVLREPIKETFGPSILKAFELAPGLAEKALADIEAKLQERLASKIAWQLSKASPDVPASV